MKGIEYILKLHNIHHQDIADKLGIRRQSISLWVNGKQRVSKRYLPKMAEMFEIDQEYFQKEINDIDKLIIQKEKLKKELNTYIINCNSQLMLDVNTDLIEKPISNSKVINDIELEIEKIKILGDFTELVGSIGNGTEIEIFNQVELILRKHRNEKTLKCIIETLSHYYFSEDLVGTYGSDGFVNEFLELLNKYDK